MPRLAALLVLLLLSPWLLSEQQSSSSEDRPSAKRIEEGWLTLFDGQSTFGWDIDGEARVEKGKLILGGTKPTRAQPTAHFGSGTYQVKWTCRGKGAVVFSDGIREAIHQNATMDLTYSTQTTEPTQRVRFTIPADTKVIVERLWFQPGRTVPLFNGKDLTGWKVFRDNPKQARSRFSVTKEGWLNVKDGPGDLQTEQLYDDFVLQLQCISNGDHLNSGIFFRCLPDKYQQGYEAQIRNQFTPAATQKYTIEEYDPKTHLVIGKKTLLSPAIDYGTGAIYRRMPARLGLARDREWFTLTILARGRHLATWVNDVQVVDWTDNRPTNDNARQGYRAAAGAISIQGHDPTTDLSFRNLRIATLSRGSAPKQNK